MSQCTQYLESHGYCALRGGHEGDCQTADEARVTELEAVIRWALGEEGEFVSPPDILIERISAGKFELASRYPVSEPSRLYWWRSELRERAKLSPTSPAKSAVQAPSPTTVESE